MGAESGPESGADGKPRPATVGVPRETAVGERRVALVPLVVGKLRSRGVTVVVEPGAGLGAAIPDESYVRAGAVLGDPWKADAVVKVSPPTAERDRTPAGRRRARRVSLAADVAADRGGPAGRRRARVRDGVHPPDLAGAEHGRAVVTGQRRGLPGGAAGCHAAHPLLPDADHGRRYREARDHPRARRRRRGPAGPGHRQAARCPHDRLRRAPRGGRPGAVARRAVARPGHRGGRAGRLCAGADRGRAGRAAEAARGRDHRLRRGDHHGERPGASGTDAGDRDGRGRHAPRAAWSSTWPGRAVGTAR